MWSLEAINWPKNIALVEDYSCSFPLQLPQNKVHVIPLLRYPHRTPQPAAHLKNMVPMIQSGVAGSLVMKGSSVSPTSRVLPQASCVRWLPNYFWLCWKCMQAAGQNLLLEANIEECLFKNTANGCDFFIFLNQLISNLLTSSAAG